MIQVVCWKWTKEEETFRYRETYTAAHVNAFAEMVRKGLTCPHEIVCITDDPEGIDSDIRIVPMWRDLKEYGMCYRRLKLFSKEMKYIIGDRFVSMDLDCVVTGDITPLFENDNDFMIWQHRTDRTPYCGSMWMMNAGARSFVWEEFNENSLVWANNNGGWKKGKSNRWVYKPAFDAGFVVGSDQAYISYKLYPNEKVWTADHGVYNFNNIKELPEDARLIFFPGKHDPNHVDLYEDHPWIPEYYPTIRKRASALSFSGVINIVCFKWGNWPVDYVYKLRNMIERNVTLPYKFYCFSDKEIPGINTIIIPEEALALKKNFPKFYTYSKDNGLSGRTALLDLDVVIVDNIDEMLQYGGEWCGIRPLGKKAANHRGGAFVVYNQDKFHWLYDDVIENKEQYEEEYSGNERFVYRKYFSNSDTWQDLYPGYLQSYKFGVRRRKSKHLKFIAFHGSPRPHEVSDPLITENWQ